MCYGARHAPDQFETYVPDTVGTCDLVAAGGIAAHAMSRHRRMKRATSREALGILTAGDGTPLNPADSVQPDPAAGVAVRP